MPGDLAALLGASEEALRVLGILSTDDEYSVDLSAELDERLLSFARRRADGLFGDHAQYGVLEDFDDRIVVFLANRCLGDESAGCVAEREGGGARRFRPIDDDRV